VKKADPTLIFQVMDNGRNPERVEEMLDVMLYLPRSAWRIVLVQMEKKIGTAALEKIIRRACDSDPRCVIEKRGASAAKKESQADSRQCVH